MTTLNSGFKQQENMHCLFRESQCAPVSEPVPLSCVCSIKRCQQGDRDQLLPAGHHVWKCCRLSALGETPGQRVQVCPVWKYQVQYFKD